MLAAPNPAVNADAPVHVFVLATPVAARRLPCIVRQLGVAS